MLLAVPSSAWAAPTITEFTSGSGPTEIAAGPDGNVWFVEAAANSIGRVTPAGVVTHYSANLSGNAGLSGIVLGPDGNLWFTERNQAQIGRITTGATPAITEYSAGITGGSAPEDIAAGADGNLWFTESGADSIGRITTSGTVTEFLLSGSNHSPSEITAGPDGNLWFSEQNAAGGIGMITTSGAFTSYALTSDVPWGITAGPDGNLWFANSANHGEIDRISTAGTLLTPFTTGLTHDGNPLDITTGADGNLYATESAGGGALARITPSGVVTEFTTNLTHPPTGITAGPDGNIWFTEGGSNKVGRLTVAPGATTSAASSVTSADATLAGSVTPRFQASTYYFEWGLTSAYGTSTTTTSAGNGTAAVPVEAVISGLAPSTTYHFRVVATNGAGTTLGLDQSFTTASPFVAPPAVLLPPAALLPATHGLPPATRPVLGKSATIAIVSGTVLVELPGGSESLSLSAASTVPVGTTIDASAGAVRLTNVRDRSGKLQTGKFWGGAFVVRQARTKRAPTVLTLTAPMTCSRARHLSSVTPKKVRQLWGNDNHGRFVTRGRSAVATVRGTAWFTRDTCAGTLVKVTRGSVSVRDLVKHRTVVVTAGRSYLARLR
jgi:virginiamycin B lyase